MSITGIATKLWATALCLAACSACGKEGVAPSRKQHEWTFAGYSEPPTQRLGIVTAPGRVGLLTPDGKILAAVETTEEPPSLHAVNNGDIVMLSLGGPLFAIDVKSGKTLWSADLPNAFVSIGKTTVAMATPSAITVRKMDGTEVYRRDTGTKALRVIPGQGYITHDGGELAFLPESGGERWRHPVTSLADSALAVERDSIYVLRADRSFEERHVQDGHLISKGTCEGEPSKSGLPLNCDGAPASNARGYPRALHFRPAPGMLDGEEAAYDYYLWIAQPKHSITLVARDRVGRERWRSPWPSTSVLDNYTVYRDTNARTIGFLAGQDAKALLVYDDETGALLFQHPLARTDQLAGLAGTCWVVATQRSVACLDGRSGVPVWTIETSGSATRAWPLSNEQALIADGNPLTLSRITREGRSAWQLEISDSALSDGALMRRFGRGSSVSWLFSDSMGVVETFPGLAVIDLTTGRRVQFP